MKKTNFFLVISLLAFSLVSFSSCSEDEDKEETIVVDPASTLNSGEITFTANAYDKWVYFSFEADTIVDVTDFSNSTNWDIAFHRYDVRVNCGKSGIGLGGTYDMGVVDFESVTEAPETGYSLNDSINAYNASPMAGGTIVSMPGDTLMAKWLTFAHTSSGASYTINNNIYVVKTAKGKYAKVWLKNYYNESGASGYPTMKYVYQTDGSRKLN